MTKKIAGTMVPTTRAIAPYVRGAAREAKARELAQRIVVGGQTPLEAGAELGLTRDQVYKILRGAAYKRDCADLFAVIGPERKAAVVEAERRMWELVPRAIQRTSDILEGSADDAVALRAANSILDRTGLRAKDRAELGNVVLVLSDKQQEVIAECFRVARATLVVDPTKETDETES
jgi:hypothetical protein